MRMIWIGFATTALALGMSAGCGGDEGTTGTTGGTSSGGDAQTPPQGAAALDAWIAKGDYKTWKCEAAIHASRSPSPHGFNRICSNDLISANATGTAVFPKGAAGVKELYADANGKAPIGYAVYLKTAEGDVGGDAWYWYEKVPLDHPAPHDANGVVADGLGTSGPAKDICVGCHEGAGSDAAHTPTPGGRDFVYTPVN